MSMSFIIQRSKFIFPKSSLYIDSTPSVTESIEAVALALGADRDDEFHNTFYFRFKDEKTAEKVSKAFEDIIDKIAVLHTCRMEITCGKKSIYIEGDDNTCKALYAIIQAFDLEENILDKNTIILPIEEENRFEAIHSIAQAMGIISYC